MATTFFSAILDPVKRTVAELLRDENFGEDVTYKRYTGQTFSSALGHTVNTYDDADLKAVRMWHNQDSVKVATSDVQIGDMLFLFHGDTFPANTSLKDVIVDEEGNELGVKGIDPIFELAVVVTVHGAK
jgi:hypothetical protein